MNAYHNTDIAACGHATCPSRESCLRWVIGQRMDEYQCFGEFKPKNGVCAYHIWTQERVKDNDNDNGNGKGN